VYCDGNGNPLVWIFSKAAELDSLFGLQLIKKAFVLRKRLGADKAYDKEYFRKDCLNLGGIPVIEYRSSTEIRSYEDIYEKNKGYCTKRWKLERLFAHSDNTNRRIDRFYEKSIEAYGRLYKIFVMRHYFKLIRTRLFEF